MGEVEGLLRVLREAWPVQCWSVWHTAQASAEGMPSWCKGCVFLHLVVNGMRWGEAAQPEALLTHAVVVALLTLVAQTSEVLPAAAVTGGLVDDRL